MSTDASENGLPEDEMEMLTRVADRLSVMGHPTRLMIIGMLKACEEVAVGEIAERLQLPMASVSQHLKTMERVGLLRYRRVGRQNYYSVRMQMVSQICDVICHQLEEETQNQSCQLGVFQRLRGRLQG